jgi:hypothetical protein
MQTPYPRLRSAVTFALSFLLFYGCSKSTDFTTQQEQTFVADNATTPDLSTCKIRRIYQDIGGFTQSGLFSYNKAGQPYSLLYSNNGTGNPDHFFIYDAQGRLSEYQKRYSSFVVERHQYGYNASNQIVKDTFTSREAGVHYIGVSTIEYDATGRVIKETIVNTFNDSGPLDATRRPTYTYDSRGNLAVAGWKSSSYDYKINPLRQSPVFQFVLRNYSMNNAAVQAKYNSRGLPLSAHPSNDNLFNSSVTYKIIYDCE